MKPFLRKALFDFTESLWGVGFFLAGRINQRPVQHWHSPGGQRILALAPHPDDEVAGCGGTLIRHKQVGDTVRLVYITDGSGSHALGLASEDMASLRASEARESARLLGVDQAILIQFEENHWQVSELVSHLKTLLIDFAPHIIYAPSLVDFHPEHQKVAHSLALALDQTPLPPFPTIRVYQLHVPLTANLINLVTPTKTVSGVCQSALAAHGTQWGSTERVIRMWHYSASYFGLPKQAEVFWEISAQEFSHLHRNALPWPTHPFRGVRARPFDDPLAYLSGKQARKVLLGNLRNS